MSPNNPSWRKSLLQQLEARNKIEIEPWKPVIQTCVSLFEKIDSLQREKCLTTENSPSSVAILERFNALQNEHKECQKHIQDKDNDINQLNLKIASLIKEKNDLKSKNNDLIITIDAMNSKCKSLEEIAEDIKKSNELIKDEYSVLQMTCHGLEKRNRELTEKLNRMKWKELEKKNEKDNLRIQQEKQNKKPIFEETPNSASIISNVNDETNSMFICESPYTCVVPTHATFCFEAHNEVLSMKYDKKTGFLTTGGGDRKVKIWNLNDMKATLVETLAGHNAGVTSIDIMDEFLVASSNDYASRVWTLNDNRLRRTLTGHSNKVMSVKFCCSKEKIVSGSYDKTLKIWDVNRNVCTKTFFAESSCNDLANINDHSIASAHIDKKIRFWDSRTESKFTHIELQGKVTSLDLSNCNNYLICSLRTVNTLRCLDLRMNKVVRDYTAEAFNIGFDWTRVKLSPDNRFVACGSSNGSIFFWDFATGNLEKLLSTAYHNGTAVVSVDWHPKGLSFISADRNKNVVFWT